MDHKLHQAATLSSNQPPSRRWSIPKFLPVCLFFLLIIRMINLKLKAKLSNEIIEITYATMAKLEDMDDAGMTMDQLTKD